MLALVLHVLKRRGLWGRRIKNCRGREIRQQETMRREAPRHICECGGMGDEMMMMGSPLSWQLLGVGDCGEPPNNCSPRSPTVIILSASCLISAFLHHPLIFFLLLLHLPSLSLSSPSCYLGYCFFLLVLVLDSCSPVPSLSFLSSQLTDSSHQPPRLNSHKKISISSIFLSLPLTGFCILIQHIVLICKGLFFQFNFTKHLLSNNT